MHTMKESGITNTINLRMAYRYAAIIRKQKSVNVEM